MDDDLVFAHSIEGRPQAEWEPWGHHSLAVADRAESFAGAFGAAELGRAAGLLHDAGKLRAGFQRYIRGEGPRAEHAICGAALARQRYDRLTGQILAYVAAGHHGGLPDGGGGDDRSLATRLQGADALLADMAPWPERLPLPARPAIPLGRDRARLPFAAGFFTRMVFSALVDADFLETERFYDDGLARTRRRIADIALSAIEDRVTARAAELARSALQRAASAAERRIAERREAIRAACLDAATRAPGVFALSVPTGGGKTLASLAFALRHARTHGLRRVVYVIPYTSIIEQTADVFRRALGPDLAEAVVEHHSAAAEVTGDDGEDTMGRKRLRLAAENWDAPVVVTTSVQFFESLYASRVSRCRKLHNLAGAVVVLDEVQTLPTSLLEPCLAALRELADNYRASVVLCSATVPDLRHSPNLGSGFPDMHEIAQGLPDLAEAFRRVQAEKAGALDDAALAGRLAAEPQALCIVDARDHAAALYALVAAAHPDGTFHLSAAMCPAHRRAVLAEIRDRLADGRRCRLVATQVVEAGVDVDFPVVYRAAAGIDSLVQAAGRCNREGRRGLGRFVIFDPARDPALPELKLRRDLALPLIAAAEDPLAPEVVRDYFDRLLRVEKGSLDAKRILPRFIEAAGRGIWPFRSIADDFRVVDEDTVPLIVPWRDVTEPLAADLAERTARGLPVPIETYRALQQVSVSAWPHQMAALERAGAVAWIGGERRHALLVAERFYDAAVGLVVRDRERRPEDNIC